MITKIVEFLGFEFNLAEDHVGEGNCKTDMEDLIHQGMIYVDGNTSTMMVWNKSIIDFPNPRKVKI